MNLSSVNFSRVDLEGENIIGPFLQVSLVCSYYTSIAVQLLEFGLGSELFLELVMRTQVPFVNVRCKCRTCN